MASIASKSSENLAKNLSLTTSRAAERFEVVEPGWASIEDMSDLHTAPLLWMVVRKPNFYHLLVNIHPMSPYFKAFRMFHDPTRTTQDPEEALCSESSPCEPSLSLEVRAYWNNFLWIFVVSGAPNGHQRPPFQWP